MLVVRAGARFRNRLEFDELYRSHLANVYRFLDLTRPRNRAPSCVWRSAPCLNRPAVRSPRPSTVRSLVPRVAGGRILSCGRAFRLHARQEVSRPRSALRRCRAKTCFCEWTFTAAQKQPVSEMEARLNVAADDPQHSSQVTVRFDYGRANLTELRLGGVPSPQAAQSLPSSRFWKRACRCPPWASAAKSRYAFSFPCGRAGCLWMPCPSRAGSTCRL